MASKKAFGSVLVVMAAPALMATIAAAYTAFWFYNAETLKDNLNAFAKTQKAKGNTVQYEFVGTSGFPLNIVADLKNVNIRLKPKNTTWGLSAPTLTLSSGILSPRSVTMAIPTGAKFSVRNAKGTNRLTKTDGSSQLTITTDSTDSIREATLSLANFKATGEWNHRTIASPLVIGEGNADLVINSISSSKEKVTPPYATLTIALRQWQWPTNVTYKLGKDLESFNLSAKIMGDIDRTIDVKQALSLWREEGGKITVDRIAMNWGPSTLAGYGTLVLDEEMQPAANLTAQVTAFNPIVDVLNQAHLIRERDATMARLVIGRQMPRSGAGNLSLSLRSGTVYVGPLALTQVPLIEWPTEAPKHLSPTGKTLLEPGFDIGKDGKITN